jgi:hypothetical protein
MNLNETENIYKQYIRGSNGQKGNKVFLRTNEYTETASEISSLVWWFSNFDQTGNFAFLSLLKTIMKNHGDRFKRFKIQKGRETQNHH